MEKGVGVVSRALPEGWLGEERTGVKVPHHSQGGPRLIGVGLLYRIFE
jgi:hypothetical protein